MLPNVFGKSSILERRHPKGMARRHGGTLSVLGLCAYCEAPTSMTCRLCGRAMCEDHAVEGGTICIDCAAGRRMEE